ncbi:MAG: DUF1501 domain-containing protein [Gammaproteobacteria bacterium]
MSKSKQYSRRRFLRNMAMASGGAGLLASHGKLGLMQSALAATGNYSNISDYKSLVCVYLLGGNDGFNMFVPNTTTEYDQYAQIRGNLSINQEDLLTTTSGDYGFHPSMPNIRNLYNSGRLGVLANVGTLIQPTTPESIENESAILPKDLFSHSHQTETWQTTRTPLAGITQDGWGGRMADLLEEANSNPLVSPTFSVAGHNNWQAGRFTEQFALNKYNGAEPFLFLGNESWPPWESSRTETWHEMLNDTHPNFLVREAGASFSQARDQIGAVRAGLEQATLLTTHFNPQNDFAQQMKIVANMISVREQMGLKRQLFFVAIGGWDSHGNQLNEHSNNLAKLDDGLNSFNAAMDELNTADSVVSFTMSEFGRTLTVNGDGTDHAWGSHALMMGGPVAGGQVHGTMPQFVLGGPDDIGSDGRIIPTTSLDQYAATLSQWMGIEASDISELYPNLGNFNTSSLDFLV